MQVGRTLDVLALNADSLMPLEARTLPRSRRRSSAEDWLLLDADCLPPLSYRGLMRADRLASRVYIKGASVEAPTLPFLHQLTS